MHALLYVCLVSRRLSWEKDIVTVEGETLQGENLMGEIYVKSIVFFRFIHAFVLQALKCAVEEFGLSCR